MTPAESKKGEDPPLTAADLDEIDAKRKAAQVGECSYEPNGTTLDGTEVGALLIAGGRATYIMAAPGRYAAALLNIAPSLLALARRGLEADGMIRIWEREETATEAILDRMGIPRRDDAPCDLHGDLTTPARVEIAESKLAAALAEVERVRGRLAMAEAVTFKAAARVVSQMDTPPAAAQVALALAQHRALMVRTLGEQGDMAAAEAQAGQAAKQGGEGRA